MTAQQILDAYNAVANGGVFVAPRLVRADGEPQRWRHTGHAVPLPPGDRPHHQRPTGVHARRCGRVGNRDRGRHRRLHRGRKDRDRPDPQPQPPRVHPRRLRGLVRRVRPGRGPGAVGGGGPRPPHADLRWCGGRAGVLDHHGLRPPPLRHPHHSHGDTGRVQHGHRCHRYHHGAGRSDHGRTRRWFRQRVVRPPSRIGVLGPRTCADERVDPRHRRGRRARAIRHRPRWPRIEFDSRRVTEGTLFCCVPGTHTDGHLHAAEAVAAGAGSLLCERFLELDVTQVRVARVR